MNPSILAEQTSIPWHKGGLIGQKLPLKLKEIWAIRVRLQLAQHIRDLALFNLAIYSKLRGCDLVQLHVADVALGTRILSRAIVMKQKIHRPVQFEITEQTRTSISTWIEKARLMSKDYLFPSRVINCGHITTRQYARIVVSWVESDGLNRASYGTHTIASYKGYVNLPPNEESASSTAFARAYKT